MHREEVVHSPAWLPLAPEQEAWMCEFRRTPAETMRCTFVSTPEQDRRVLAQIPELLLSQHDALRVRIEATTSGWRQRFPPPEDVLIRPVVVRTARELSTDDAYRVLNGMLQASAMELSSEGPVRFAFLQDRCTTFVGAAVDRVALDALAFTSFSAELVTLSHAGPPREVRDARFRFDEHLKARFRKTSDERLARNTEWWIDEAKRVALDRLQLPTSEATVGISQMAEVPLLPFDGRQVVEAARRRRCTPAALALGVTAGTIARCAGHSPVLFSIPATPARALVPSWALGNFTIPLPLVVNVTGDLEGDVQAAADALFQGLAHASYSVSAWQESLRRIVQRSAAIPMTVIFVYRDPGTASSAARHQAMSGQRPRLFGPNHIEFWFNRTDELSGFIRHAGWHSPALVSELASEIHRRFETLLVSV